MGLEGFNSQNARIRVVRIMDVEITQETVCPSCGFHFMVTLLDDIEFEPTNWGDLD